MDAGIIALGSALIQGIPKIISAIRAGRDPRNIKLGEIVANDAFDKIKSANSRARDYIENG